jgi:prepilin-type N-terminal cleavage/methylation domain-containing protein
MLNRKLSKKGFSLIELMVAIAILAMAIFGIFHAYSVGFMGMADARDRTVATNYAREAMEDVKNMDFEKITTTTKSVINANKKYRIDVNVSMESTNLKKVSTMVSWEDRNGIRKTVESSMIVNVIEVFASDAAKIVLFTESYNILNSFDEPEYEKYASTELTAVIKDIKGNTITDWGEDPDDNEGPISFLITSENKFGTLSDDVVTPINGRAYTTFTSNGLMSGNFGINEIEASVYLPDPGKTVTDTTTIKITNGPVKIKLEPNPGIIKASTTNSSTITVSLKDASGKTLSKKEIFADVEINLSVFGEGNLSTSTIIIPFLSGDPSDASAVIILNSTGNPGLVTVIATAANLESDKTDVRFLGPPVAISISANPNPMYLDDNYSTISVSLIDINGINTNPTDDPITISLVLTADTGTEGNLEEPSSWDFPVSDSEGIIKETKFSGQLFTGTATIVASGGEFTAVSVAINVILALTPDHIKLIPSYEIIPKGSTSTIKAIVYDYSGKIVSNYTGYITFTKAPPSFGTFSGGNLVYTTNGIAEIALSSDISGTATIEASLVYNEILKESIEAAVVEFYGTIDHIELNASSKNVKIGVGNFSTITATVCDSNSIHVPEYTGEITFTTDLGTFSGGNLVYTTNGIAEIELFSEAVGTATITASADSISSNNICEVEFYEETTLTLVDDIVIYDSTDKTVTFDVKVAGENIKVEEMKVSWVDSSASERLSIISMKIPYDTGTEVDVYNGDVKSGISVNIIDKELTIGESTIKLTFVKNMAGKSMEVIFYLPFVGSYTIGPFWVNE